MEQQRDTTIKWERIADNIGQFRALLGSNLDRLSYEGRQAVVQLVVEKVVVYPDGAVEVHHVLPFEEPPVVTAQKKAPWVNFMSCDCNTSTAQRFWYTRTTCRGVSSARLVIRVLVCLVPVFRSRLLSTTVTSPA